MPSTEEVDVRDQIRTHADPLTRILLILTFVTGIVDAVCFLALCGFMVGGSAAALLTRPANPSAGGELRLAMACEVGLLGLAAVLAALIDVDPGDLSAYLLIAILSTAMGLRNTIARRIGDPNLATTVLNLTLSAFVSHTPTGIASEGELTLRGAAIAAILAGAVTGALLLEVSLALAIAAAAAVVVAAALGTAATHDGECACTGRTWTPSAC